MKLKHRDQLLKPDIPMANWQYHQPKAQVKQFDIMLNMIQSSNYNSFSYKQAAVFLQKCIAKEMFGNVTFGYDISVTNMPTAALLFKAAQLCKYPPLYSSS